MLAPQDIDEGAICHGIGLVEHQKHVLAVHADLFEHLVNGFDLPFRFGMAGIHDVQKQIRPPGNTSRPDNAQRRRYR